MADPDKNQGELSQEISEVKDELKNILSRLDSMEARPLAQPRSMSRTNPAPLTTGTGQTFPSLGRPGPSGLQSRSTTIEEHRKLFARYPQTKNDRSKRGKGPRRVPTCTLKFVCLAQMNATKPASTVKERMFLTNAGLGECSIQLQADCNQMQCHEAILKTFPKLAEVGYDVCLYQRGEEGGFFKIDPPYTARRLKDAAASAKIYLRPLQKDLDINEVGISEIETNLDVCLEIKCLKCGLLIPMTDMGEHSMEHEAPPRKRQMTINVLDMQNSQSSSLPSEIVSPLGNGPSTLQRDMQASGSASEDNDMAKLMEMFPNESMTSIKDVLDSSLTVEDAVDTLIKEKIVECDDQDPPTMLQTTETSHEEHKGMAAEEILKLFRAGIIKDKGPTTPITFNRSKKPIRELCRIYKNSSSDKLARPPVVYFTSETGDDDEYEEEAADVGGPMKEFMTLASETVLKCIDPHLFEGDIDHKLPVHSQQMVLNGFFVMAGKVMAHAITHGEIWITGLAKPVKVFLATGCAEQAAQATSIEDVPDLEIQELLRKMNDADESGIKDLNSDTMLTNLMVECGVSAALLNSNNAAQVSYEIMVYQVVHKRLRELEDIRQGLDVLKIGNLLYNHPKVAPLIFPTSAEARIDVDVLKRKLRKHPSAMDSEESSKAFQFLLNYFDEVSKREMGVDIRSVLTFITGTAQIPTSEITIQFLSESEHNKLPDPDTCTNSLKLPTCYNAYEDFQSVFDSTVIIQGKGYGRP